jgi:hypothetical protein
VHYFKNIARKGHQTLPGLLVNLASAKSTRHFQISLMGVLSSKSSLVYTPRPYFRAQDKALVVYMAIYTEPSGMFCLEKNHPAEGRLFKSLEGLTSRWGTRNLYSEPGGI